MLGVLAEEKLAAYSIIRYPGMGKDNLGWDLNLAEEDPKNPVSLNNLLSYKNWPMTGAGMAATGDESAITCLNIECQRELIQRGYEGYRVEWNGEKSEIFYRKRSTPAMDSSSPFIP